MAINGAGNSALRLLNRSKIEVLPESFYLVSMSHPDWLRLLNEPDLSPRMSAPFMIFRDNHEVTMLLDEVDFAALRDGFDSLRAEGGFRLVTFDIEMDFKVVGFMALVSGILAEAGVSIVALSAFTRDHILIKQVDLSSALKALRGYVDEIC
jgi:hypothetical protein